MPAEDFLTQLADILAQDPDASEATGLDTVGGVDRSLYVPVAMGVPCLVRPIGASNDPRQERDETLRAAIIYFLGYQPKRSNRIVVDGQVYEVIGPRPFNSKELVAVDVRAVLE